MQRIFADGSSGGCLYHYGTQKLATKSNGIAVSGIVTAISGVVTYYGDGSQLTGISASPGGSDGQIQYNNGGSFGGASQLYYDDANNRVGIGSASPTAKLDVAGTVRATLFTGDGSGLYNITATGSGVGIQSNTSVVGTAQTINFGTNLAATISGGVATITATGGGSSTTDL